MRVVVIRHGEVDFCLSGRCTSEEFDRECGEYDKAPVKDMIYEIPQAGFRNVYISTLPRSRDTACRLFPDKILRESELIDEVPLRSSFDTGRKMPLWFWNVSGRIQWLFNSPRQTEGRRQTRKRAGRFVEILCREASDCAVVTHGFFMITLLREMRKAGFRMGKTRAGFKNGEYVDARRSQG